MWAFRAMNTDVCVLAPSLSDGALARLGGRIAALFEQTERRFSRFRRESELMRLNAAEGPMHVSEALFEILKRARHHLRQTDGVFDPAIGSALSAAGYDRSFAPGALDRSLSKDAPQAASSFREVILDEARRTVTRPAHVQIDLGGLVKGWAVDRAAQMLPCAGAVDAGGDIMVWGDDPCDALGQGWHVEIEDPHARARTLMTLRVRNRAVATSAANRRRWRVGAEEHHHLIDPRTQRCAQSDLAQVTVLAQSAEQADVLAKAMFVLGSERGIRLLERHLAVGCVLVMQDGRVRTVGDVEVCDG